MESLRTVKSIRTHNSNTGNIHALFALCPGGIFWQNDISYIYREGERVECAATVAECDVSGAQETKGLA